MKNRSLFAVDTVFKIKTIRYEKLKSYSYNHRSFNSF